ncbi:unnamed protein product [Scytosiphon promiscuus]
MELTSSGAEAEEGAGKRKTSSSSGSGGGKGGSNFPVSSAPLSSTPLAEETAAAAAAGTSAQATSTGLSFASSSSSSPSPLSQPLEEVNPSVLNANEFSSNGSGGGSGGGGSGNSGGGNSGVNRGEDGKGGGRTPPQAACLEAPIRPDEGSGSGVGGGGDGGGFDASPGGTLPVPPARVAGAASSTGARSAVVDRRTAGNPSVRPAAASAAAAAAAMGRTPGGSSGSPERPVKPPAVGGMSGGGGGGGVGVAGVGEPGASRLKGKSVEAHGSTGVSPMQKRNRRELKLSEEETAMAGAPQGPVYQVSVLETAEFEPSPNPAEEMRAVRAASAGGGDWADLYSAVDSARRLCIFHGEAVVLGGGGVGDEEGGAGDGSNLEGVVSLLAAAVGNLRSSMVRNALLGVGDIFSFLKHDVGRVDIRPMVAGTLQRLAGDKRFICQTAAQVMEAAARSGPSVDVLHAILPSLDDRNAEVAAKSAFYAEMCLATLGVGSKAGAGLPEGLELRSMVPGMSRALNGKVGEGRASARRALLRSRKAMGLAPFEAAVAATLEKPEASALLNALAAPNRAGAASAAAAGGPSSKSGLAGRSGLQRRGGSAAGRGRGGAARPSIREQMMAARRKKEEAEGKRGGSAAAAGDGFVVVT